MRQEKMKCQQVHLKKGLFREKKYSNLDLITSCEDLKTILSEIENENISSTKKAQKKHKIIGE